MAAVEAVNAESLVTGVRTGRAQRRGAKDVPESPVPSVFVAHRRRRAWTLSGKWQRNGGFPTVRSCARCPPFVRVFDGARKRAPPAARPRPVVRFAGFTLSKSRSEERAHDTPARAHPRGNLWGTRANVAVYFTSVSIAREIPATCRPFVSVFGTDRDHLRDGLERANSGFDTCTGNDGEMLWVPLNG